MKLMISIGCLTLSVYAQQLEFGSEGDCGFAALKPSLVSHFVDTAALSKVSPKYPVALKALGSGGKVYVRLLVNSSGQVERTCPEYPRGQARPHRSLVVAAEAAALEWRYKPNFGIVATGGSPKLRYIEGTIAFDFVP
jgi:hypothetical protein